VQPKKKISTKKLLTSNKALHKDKKFAYKFQQSYSKRLYINILPCGKSLVIMGDSK